MGLRSERQLAGDVSVNDEEIKAFFEASVAPGTELTDEARSQVEAALRKRKTDARKAGLAERVRALRESADVTIREKNL